jgi:cytochrome c oxidase assembly protein subunit 15
VFFVPFLVFLLRGQIERSLIPRLLGLLILGGLQGALGWYMVASGLVERVSVSQYRLVAHLSLALAIYVALLWTAFPLWRGVWPVKAQPHGLFRLSLVALCLVFVQIMLGGFVAGLDAGLIYNTWPLMDEVFVPGGAYRTWLAPFEDVTTVQFNHRIGAYILTVVVGLLWFYGRRQGLVGQARLSGDVFLGVLVLQVLLGIWTLIEVVPVWLGALHQAGAVALLTAAVVHAFQLYSPRQFTTA